MQKSDRSVEVVFFHENIIRVIRRNDEHADLIFRKDVGYFRQNADERKIERTFYSETALTVFSCRRVIRNVFRSANKGNFFIRFA